MHLKGRMRVSREINRQQGSWRWRLAGARALSAASLIAVMLVPGSLGASGERTIALYNVHTQETIRIAYKRNGRFVPGAVEKLNWFLRDWRRDEATKIDPGLIDLVWEVHTELGSRVPVHVISGYRSPQTNAALRQTRGGQAKRSQHMLGKAMDVMFPDIPVRRLRYSALLREQGGVGYYPTSATPFVHIDTGRVRHWPRMGREELALLFPSGRTQHRPSDGGPITRGDAVLARESNPALAQRVAAFYSNRRDGPLGDRAETRVASAVRSAPVPELVSRPRLARPALQPLQQTARADVGQWIATARPKALPSLRVATLMPAPGQPPLPVAAAFDPQPLSFREAQPVQSSRSISSDDRSQLAHLAHAPLPFAGNRSGSSPIGQAAAAPPYEWIRAPEFDEEHPEELFYRPFPIAPFITQTSSADDPALMRLTHPDIDKTLALLAADGTADPPLQMRPGLQAASLMWSQSFRDTGGFDGGAPDRPSVTSPPSQTGAWQTAGTWLGQQLVQLGR